MCLPLFQILCFLLVCVIICWIGSWIYESVHGAFFVGYAEYYSTVQDSPAEIAFLQILSSIVVLSNYVPISLYVRSVPMYLPMSCVWAHALLDTLSFVRSIPMYVTQISLSCQYLCMCPYSLSGQYLYEPMSFIFLP